MHWMIAIKIILYFNPIVSANRDGVHKITLDLNGCQPEDVKISVKDKIVSYTTAEILVSLYIGKIGYR